MLYKSMDWFLYDRDLRHERNKVPLSGLREFLTNESPLKLIKNAFYFVLKALFKLKIITFSTDFLII